MSFNTTENKKLIWSLLLESSYFKGFPASQKDMVKRVLDSVINELGQNPSVSQMDITDKNREVVKQMVMYRDLWAQDGIINQQNQQQQHQHQQQQHQQHSHQLPPHQQQQYQELPALFDNSVTAEDLRDQRNKQFNESFNQKQAEMNQLLNASKPQEIDFSDSAKEQRIGGDMERLVAQAEAARQQQMDMLMNGNQNMQQQQAEKWINGGRPLKIDNDSKLQIESQNLAASSPSQPSQRKVHFSDDNNNYNNNNNSNIDNDIFAKLKKKTNQNNQTNESNQSNENNHVELLRRVELIEITMSNIQKSLNKLTEIINNTNEIKITDNL